MYGKLIVVFVIVGIVCTGCIQIPAPPKNKATPRLPDPTRQVVSNTLPFTEVWKTPNLDTAIIAKDRVLAITQSGSKKIVAFAAQTGDFIWESEQFQGFRSLEADNNHVYIGTINYVQAFDLETGKTLWKGAEQPVSKKGALDVYPTDKQLEVYDFDKNLLYLLDNQTGQTIEKIEHPLIFFRREGIYYSGMCGPGYNTRCLKATTVDGNTLWSQDFKGTIYLWPIFLNDTMFLNAGGNLLAVDARKGNIVWQSDNGVFITSPVLGGDTLYALREDATIVGFDPKTGEQVGTIEITPKQTRYNAGYIAHYTMTATDRYLAVYYGDSKELIVFEKADDLGNVTQ